MSREPQDPSPFFHFDVSDAGGGGSAPSIGDQVVCLLRRIVDVQERQGKLLEELVSHLSSAQRQRANELGQWRQANPELARGCRLAAECLSQVQTEFLRNLTEEVNENAEHLMDGEFMLNEFVDRFGPRLAHLNGVLQVLSQLSSVPETQNSTTSS